MDSPGFSTRRLGEGLRQHAGVVCPVPRHSASLWRLVSGLKDFIRHWTPGSEWPRRLLRRLCVGGMAVLVLYFAYLYLTLPDISDPRTLLAAPAQSTVITDRNGTELYRLFEEQDRTYVDLAVIPQHMMHAIVAIEDERFYERGCLDVQAIVRAVVTMGRGGGASTITRQLARNALGLQRLWIVNRKLKELILGCQMEAQYTKDQLLELYLNWIPFGQNAYGIEQASQRYFGKTVRDLTLAQAAVLAALPQRPSYFSPYGKHVRTTVDASVERRIMDGSLTSASRIPDDAVRIGLLGTTIGTGSTALYVGGRTDQVLRNMQNLGFIGEADRLQALEELRTVTFQPSRERMRAPHFVLWVREQAEALLGNLEEGFLERGGLRIETTLDWEMQDIAEHVVAFHRKDVESRFEAKNIALVALDTRTSEILAYVGNTEYTDAVDGGQIDMVRIPRQPGSTFKPIVYAAAFQQGFGPATVLYDVPTKIGEDQPQNFDGQFWGPLSIRRALGASRNIPAAKAFFLAGGEDAILALAEQMGAPTPKALRSHHARTSGVPFEYGWPLALGAAETPLLEMVNAYATFGNGGMHRPPVSIRRITDRHGNILYQASPGPPQVVLDPVVAYQITSILSDVSARPNEYWQAVLSLPGVQAAAKTGTSNKCITREDAGGACIERRPSDLWTIGYTPDIAAGVWIGNADSTPLSMRAESLSIAAPLWKDFLSRAQRTRNDPSSLFPVPPGVVQPLISTLSGELPTECTPLAFRKAELFPADRPPTQLDPACVQVEIDKVTGLLASDACPEEARERGSFLVLREVLPNRFPEWQRAVEDWGRHQMDLWKATPDHSGSLLPLPVAPTEACDPSLTPGRLVRPAVNVLFPQEGGTAVYPSFTPSLDIRVGSAVRSVTYLVDGKIVAEAQAEPFTPVLRMPRSVSEDGVHTLEVRLTDEYYNVATAAVQFRFAEDTSAPQVHIILPQEGDPVMRGEALVLEAEAQDDGGIKLVQFFLNGRLLSNKPIPPFRMAYPGDLRPGRYTVMVRAEDFAGNKGEASVEIDVLP